MRRRSFLTGAAALAVARSSSAGEADAGTESAALLDASGQPLPQTEEEPSIGTERFRARIELVAGAILADDPGAATPAFFPVIAYRMVKAIQDPDRDWKLRLLANFGRDVHEYRRRLGREATTAHFAGIDVPQDRARWMKPGSEGNKLGYYRVLHSQLRFTLSSGREQSFELTSMISWRGEWYVVHLNGFK
jgi:hypothetical protein